MKPSHQAMFERCFERLYKEYCETGVPPHAAREMAADDAWTQYETYCDEARDAQRIDGLGMELNAIAAALGVGNKRGDA